MRRRPPAFLAAALASVSLPRQILTFSFAFPFRGVARRPSHESFRPPPPTTSAEARSSGAPRGRIGGRPSPPFFASPPSKDDARSDDEGPTKQPKKKYRPGSMDAAIAEQGRVPYGESSRKYRRTIYAHENWIEHRSGDRLTSNLRGLFFSGIVRQLQREVLAVTIVALVVVLWNDVVVPQWGGGPSLPHLSLPALPFTLSSPALGLLLVFRTNASYGRWMEARVAWGKIVSQSRNVVRMAETFSSSSDDEGTTDDDYRERAMDDLVRAAWFFPRSLMNALSGPEDDERYAAELKETFHDDLALVDDALSSADRPTIALMELSSKIDALTEIDEKRRVEIDKSVVILGDLQCACERIFASPVPLVYTRHTARFLSIWMLTLPLALHDVFDSAGTADAATWFSQLQGFAMAPAVGLLSLFLFGIEELAIQLEEPFSILPLQRFCDDVKESTEGMRRWNARRRRAAEGRRRSTTPSEGS